MIGGLLPVSSGQIRYEGLKDGQLPQLGMVFQDAVLLPWRTVLETLCCRSRLQALIGMKVNTVRES